MTDILLSDLSIEILGAITGLIYLYFSIRQNIWLWPWGIITSLLYIYTFFQSKFYADMSLQFYYLGVSIYGWYYWKSAKSGSTNVSLPVIRAGSFEWFTFITLIIGLTWAAGHGLDKYTDSPLPYWDAFTTAGSIVATWMLVKKYLENWLFWILIDLVSLGTYIYKGLYPTAVLFLIYTILAFVGYYQWRKEQRKTEF